MKKYWLLLMAAALLCTTACGKNSTQSGQNMSAEGDGAVTEESAELPTQADFPDADPNAVTFEDGCFDFISIVSDTPEAAAGTLSVEDVDGNMMLKFTDTSSDAENLETAVQKICVDVASLLSPDQLESVYSIGFDLYVQAKDDLFVNDDGENVCVPGWIGGGGGTVTADGEWYGFADFSASGINEYELERSDACHVTFKFLLASAGKKWDSSIEDANFLIMRWGMQNLSDLYLDNITFYDEEGNSIPLK
jgi:hypothetical protein